MHVVGPQLGLTQPGITVVCGDSPHLDPRRVRRAWRSASAPARSSTCWPPRRCRCKPFKTMAITVEGELRPGVTAKDIILAVIAQDRHRRRPGLRARVPRQRHPGALDGGPDDDLQHVDRGRRPRRHGRPGRDHLRLPEGPRRTRRRARTGTTPSPTGETLPTDDDAVFDAEVVPRRRRRSSRSSPGAPTRARACRCASAVPDPAPIADPNERAAAERALEYMDLDGRHAAEGHRGRRRLHGLVHQQPHRGPARLRRRSSRASKKADGVRVMVVPGSVRVRLEAEAEGLDKVFDGRSAPSGASPAARCASA